MDQTTAVLYKLFAYTLASDAPSHFPADLVLKNDKAQNDCKQHQILVSFRVCAADHSTLCRLYRRRNEHQFYNDL